MKPKSLVILQTLIAILFCQNIFAQFRITSIATNTSNLPSTDTVFNRKGAGVKSIATGIADRWDSSGTNFKLVFNAGANANVSVSSINITDFGIANRILFPVIAKVKRVANAEVTNVGNHYAFFVAAKASPSAAADEGLFLLNGPEVNNMEEGLVSNNINTGYNNIFQNSSDNVHYSNIERIDFVFPNGFTVGADADIRKVGFTIFDASETGNPFKIAGIKSIDNLNEVSSYITPLRAISEACFGDKLFSDSKDFVIFQKDPTFNGCESRPSVKANQNMRGVFVSLATLGFVVGQKVFGFSLFADDIPTSSNENYLLNYHGYPTNSNSTRMLDLVNSVGVYSFNQSVLASPTVLRATLQNSKVLLQWNATSLADANKVFLQKATSNMLYNDIAEVVLNQSSFVDESILTNISYYRLKIIATNGAVKYSNIQHINSKITSTQIFPTVVNDMLHFSSNTVAINKPISISVHTIDGKLLQSYNKTATSTMNIDVNNLQKGMYIISITQNNEIVIRQKFIKN